MFLPKIRAGGPVCCNIGVHLFVVYSIFIARLFENAPGGGACFIPCYPLTTLFTSILLQLIVLFQPMLAHLIVMFQLLSEPHGGEQGSVQNNHNISLVPTFLGHSLPQQEGSARRENHVLASRRLFPRIRWCVKFFFVK